MGLLNWHLLPAMDIDVTGNVGVIGENRSGKSTLLDLVQVVMTGNSGRYLRLNASANDSGRKRGMRSVHAYCLGRLSPDEVVRKDGALTYIFLCFADPADANQTATIGLALEASPSENSERTLGQFILPGRMLSVADFIDRELDGSERPRDWALVKPWLKQAGARLYDDEPAKFVADYLKTLSTGQKFINPDQFLKAFVNAISFEQIPSATEFVRRYLLEDKPIRIGQLRESIATYQSLRKNVEDARDKLTRLRAMDGLIGRFKADLAAHERDRWIAARALLDHQFAENRRLKARNAAALAELDEAKREVEEYDQLKAELADELESVKAAILAQTQGRRPEYNEARKAEEARLKAATAGLEQLHRAVNQGQHAAKFRAALPAAATPVLDLLQQARAAGGTEPVPSWPRDPQAVAEMLDSPKLNVAGLLEQCQHEIDAAIRKQVPLEERKQDLERRISDIDRKGFSLERNVEELAAELDALGFRPRILCTLLDVRDEEWRKAAEALLGRDREAILVDDAHVEDAIRHLQRNRTRYRGCRVINTRKIDPRGAVPEPGTLASVLSTDDPMVMAFVLRRIGNVRLAHGVADLHKPGRAIMTDGTYDDGLTVEMREVAGGLKIGAGAGKAGLASLTREKAEVQEDLAELGERIRDLRLAAQSLAVFAAVAGKGAELIRLCDQLQRSRERLDHIAADLRALERNVDPALQDRKDKLEAQIRAYETEARDALVRQNVAKTEISNATQKLNAGDGEMGSTMALTFAWRRFKDVRPLRRTGRPGYRAALDQARGDFRRAAEAARKAAEEVYQRIVRTQAEVFDLYLAYHGDFGLKPDFTRSEAQLARDIEPWVAQNIQRIEDVDLVRYEDHAAEAAEKTRNFFQHSFAFELRERFDGLRRSLDEMNRTLSKQDFHYERYRFVSHPVELYRDIIALVEASRDDESVFAHLFDAGVTDSHPHAKALRTVQDLLLDESRDIAEFEDYRKYYAFNMKMKDTKSDREVDLETRRGTGSGAEQQVPFYVAIGTALAAAYHGRAAGDELLFKGIGLAVFDEAFSKLDGKNQRACMEYYQKLGLQVVVAAPFEKRASLYETMESFVETIRNGDAIDVEAYEIRPRARQAFAAANPGNLELEGLRKMMEGAA